MTRSYSEYSKYMICNHAVVSLRQRAALCWTAYSRLAMIVLEMLDADQTPGDEWLYQ